MTTDIIVPEMGESVLEATVAHWLKQEGEAVSVGDVLVELETDKVNLEVGAQSSGVLKKIQVPEGKDVKVGEVLGVIDEKAAQPERPQPQALPETKAADTAPAAKAREPDDSAAPIPDRPASPQVSPVAYRLARESNIDISQVSGTGPEGRVSKADVERYMKTRETEPVPVEPSPAPEKPPDSGEPSGAAAGREDRQPMSRRRRTIAKRLLEAQHSTAMLTTFNEIDMSAVMELRRHHNEEFQKRHGVKLGLLSFFVKASLSALKAFPRLNAEIQGEEIVFKHYYDIGMAVGSEDGLVVPVIRNADQLSFAEIEKQVKELVARTQAGKLSVEDLRGGTFTITNGGVFGSLLSTPILNPPQVGILGLHKIEERPVALDGQVVIRPMMYVALSYDHRIVDGREAVQFLVHLKELIEDPGLMLVQG
jgi:2-oxoglutarate dehydrogenase E2 component (dihydrolipoamide succinyltransferase)